MFLRWILVVLFLGFGFPANAEEAEDLYFLNENIDYQQSLIFVGQLEKTTLYPKDWSKEDCGHFEANGEEFCIVSNSCGTEIIEFKVLENIHGVIGEEKVSLKTSIGEWCDYNVELAMDKKIVFALKYQNSDFFKDQHLIYTYDLHYESDTSHYFFLDAPYKFAECQEITGIDCLNLLRPVKPQYIGEGEEDWDWIREMQKQGILTRNEDNEIYLIKAIFIEDLIKELQQKK